MEKVDFFVGMLQTKMSDGGTIMNLCAINTSTMVMIKHDHLEKLTTSILNEFSSEDACNKKLIFDIPSDKKFEGVSLEPFSRQLRKLFSFHLTDAYEKNKELLSKLNTGSLMNH